MKPAATISQPPAPSAAPARARIPVYRPELSGNEEAYVLDCVRSNWISSHGAYIQRFEEAFRTFTGARQATTVCNGTAAVQVALAALGIGPGDEVLVPSFTYIASVNPITACGARPVFVEIDPDSWQMDARCIPALITPRTRALMVPHLYGNACDMAAIMALAGRHRLLVIEDCAESFGTTIDGRHTGTFGDAATFSFFGNKTITTGEGGMVVCRDSAVMRRAMAFKTQGVSPVRTYWHDVIGFNYRMTNIQAALGQAQIERAHATIARKRVLAARYRRGLAGLPLRFAKLRPGVLESAWMVSVVLDQPERRDLLRLHLDGLGIETRPFFFPAHQLPMYARPGISLPVTERISAAGFNLPSWPGLEDGAVDDICRALRAALA
jgi:perosamine synthetase